MRQRIYITNQETQKCKKVVQAFNDFLQQADILVLDTGKYGFALLKYFDRNKFGCIETYINSNELFEEIQTFGFPQKSQLTQNPNFLTYTCCF